MGTATVVSFATWVGTSRNWGFFFTIASITNSSGGFTRSRMYRACTSFRAGWPPVRARRSASLMASAATAGGAVDFALALGSLRFGVPEGKQTAAQRPSSHRTHVHSTKQGGLSITQPRSTRYAPRGL